MRSLNKITKALLIAISINIIFNVQAQETKTFDQKRMEIFSKIYPILDNAQKVYTNSGKFNQIQNWGTDANNKSYYWFYTFEGVAESGKESAKYVGYQKTWVDFSKINYVRSGVTNYGYNCIIINGEAESIKYQTSYFDDYGNRNGMNDFIFLNQITLPIDNEELVDHFNSMAQLTNEERKTNPEKFSGLNPKIEVYQKTQEDYDRQRKQNIKDGLWYTAVIGGSVSVVLLLNHLGIFN